MSAFFNIGPTLVAALGTPETVALRRASGAGSYNANTGIWSTDYAMSDVNISAVVQPTPARVMAQLVDGEMNAEGITIFTTENIQVSDQTTGIDSDLVTYQGRTFKVMQVRDWRVTHGYLRAVAIRVDGTP